MKKDLLDICDFHTHILPGVDHGSDSLDESLRQIRLAEKHGVSRIVLTSHFYAHNENVLDFIRRRDLAYSLLKENLWEGAPELLLGAEVLVCNNIEKLPMLDKICIGNSRAILLELPFNDFNRQIVSSVRNMISLGYQVVLAHANRYPKENIDVLLSEGALIQLNADSLSGVFLGKHLLTWLDSGAVVALGSDIHGVDTSAYKKFDKARERILTRYSSVKDESDKIWSSAF